MGDCPSVSSELLENRSKRKREMTDCSSVPHELLELIFEELGKNPLDSLNFGSVSKEWRDIVLDKKRNVIPRAMIMPIEHGKDKLNTHGLYSLSSSTNNWEISLPDYQGQNCVGSNNGWLIMVDAASCQIFLLNPLTKYRILLPSLHAKLQMLTKESLKDLLNKKHAFSLKFNSPSDFLIAICFDCKLFFCKAGYKKWVVRKNLFHPDGVLHYKDKLYVKISQGEIRILNLSSRCNPKYTISAEVDECSSNTYLVESQKKGLLKVIRKEVNRDRAYERDTVGFQVYMLDEDSQPLPHWVEVDNLHEEVVFLGLNAICLSAQSVPECKANSIYFTDDTDEKSWSSMGVFDMEEKSIKPLYQDCPFAPAPSMWFTPNLQQSSKGSRVSV